MIRPWHRSRLFWLGVPGLLFLLWGWINWSSPPSMAARIGSSRVTAGNWAGVLRVVWVTDPGGSGFGIAGHTGTRAPDLINPFPPAVRHSNVALPGGNRFMTVSIAYWFLILLYLPLWMGVVAGWQRRKVRLLNVSAAGSTEPVASA